MAVLSSRENKLRMAGGWNSPWNNRNIKQPESWYGQKHTLRVVPLLAISWPLEIFERHIPSSSQTLCVLLWDSPSKNGGRCIRGWWKDGPQPNQMAFLGWTCAGETHHMVITTLKWNISMECVVLPNGYTWVFAWCIQFNPGSSWLVSCTWRLALFEDWYGFVNFNGDLTCQTHTHAQSHSVFGFFGFRNPRKR